MKGEMEMRKMKKWETGIILTVVCLLVVSMGAIVYRDWIISEWYASELERRDVYEGRISDLEQSNLTAHGEIERLEDIIVELDRGWLSESLTLIVGNDTHVVEGVIINYGVETATDVYVTMEFFKDSPSGSVVFHTEVMNVVDIRGRTYVKIYQTYQFEIEGKFAFWNHRVHWRYSGMNYGTGGSGS